MTGVKICGLKRKEDIEYVNILRPDYIGFVFAKSKRQISLDFALKLAGGLSKDIKKVGIFVDEDLDKVKNIGKALNLDIIQLHGDEEQDYINNLKDFIVWKTVGIKDDKDLDRLKFYDVDGILLDSTSLDKRGGTGKSFNWEILKNLNSKTPIILAGGLHENNVQDAIKYIGPSIVDVSSGVETHGLKDFNKIQNFIEKVREVL